MKMCMIWNFFKQFQLVVIMPVNCWPVLQNLYVSSTFEGEDNSSEQSCAGNKDDAFPDVRILPSKPNQPKF